MNEPQIPWFWLAIMVIVFIRWIIDRFKRAAEQRIRDARERQRRQEQRDYPPTPPRPSYQTATPPPLPQSPSEVAQPQRTEAPQTLQELFEQRRQEIARAQRQTTSPPPQQQVAVQPTVEQKVPQKVVIPDDSPIVRGTIGSGKKRSDTFITKVFADKKQLRNAIILKEILDKPKGLDL